MTYSLQNIRFFNRCKMCAEVRIKVGIRNNGRICNNFCYPNIIVIFASRICRDKKWRRVRVVEGARLESVYMGNCIMSSNLIVSAKKNVKIILDVFLFFIVPQLSWHNEKTFYTLPLSTPREITIRCTSEVPS